MDKKTTVDFKKDAKTESTYLPGNRFPGNVTTDGVGGNVQTPSTPDGTPAPTHITPEVAIASSVKSKMHISPRSENQVDERTATGGVPLDGVGARIGVAGAPASPIGGDLSMNPYTPGGATRSGNRYGKKISLDNFLVNNSVSESIKTSFTEPKDLRENPDAVQGYNGRKQFNSARAKKSYGSTPGASLFERSVDFQYHSSVVATSGQMIGNLDHRGGYGDPGSGISMQKGNYVPRFFTFQIQDGRITNPHFEEDRVVVPTTDVGEEEANFNWQVDTNNITKTVINLQTTFGRETTNDWSPLGYVVNHPYEVNMMLHDIEATDGSLVYGAVTAANYSMSLLQNNLGKTGAAHGLNKIFEGFSASYRNYTSSAPEGSNILNNSSIFSRDEFRLGSPAAMISIFDSTTKYTTIADFLNQPRSLKLHLGSCVDNAKPFHVKKEFSKAYDKALMYSTFSGEYDPVLPVHVNDHVKFMLPYSLNSWLTNWNSPDVPDAIPGLDSGVKIAHTYSYSDIRNTYEGKVTDFLIHGLMRWMRRNEGKIASVYGNTSGSEVIRLPIDFGMRGGLNMFNFMICSALQDIVYARNIILRDVLFVGDMKTYIWDDLSSISDLSILAPSQFRFVDHLSPLKLGPLSDVQKVRVNWAEQITPTTLAYGVNRVGVDKKGKMLGYYLPWYFSESQIFQNNTECYIDADHGFNMSFPIIRNGINHDYVDVLYDYSERDVRLMLDRMVCIPVDVSSTTAEQLTTYTGAENRNRWVASGLRYDSNSDGRVVISRRDFSSDAENDDYLVEMTYLATPRELGFLFPLPCNYMPAIYSNISALTAATNYPTYIAGGYADILVCYHSQAAEGHAIDRSDGLTQLYNCFFANPCYSEANNATSTEVGIYPSIQCIVGDGNFTFDNRLTTLTLDFAVDASTAVGLYPVHSRDAYPDGYSTEGYEGITHSSLFTLSKMLWAITQRFYAPVNVFDYSFELENFDNENHDNFAFIISDPLENALPYGFSGCLSSDFSQDVLNRLGIKDDLNMYYYEDVFLKDSKIFA